MKNDEFAFFNQQLAAMVRDGIPLEAALRRLCAEMQRGALRTEMEKLEADLARGVPLREAARDRRLPELYRQMLEVGAQSNDLPAVLTMLADYYERRHLIWTRLKGLMVYPAIVLVAAFLLSCFLSFLISVLVRTLLDSPLFNWSNVPLLRIWTAPTLLGLAALVFAVAWSAGPIRRALRWRIPAYKEASLAQFASAVALMLKSGVPLPNALGLVEQLEQGTPAQTAVAQWRQRLAAGHGKFSEMTAGCSVFPPLFLWTVSQSGDDLSAGFQRAAELYRARASYRTEMLLYSALPVSILALGILLLAQIEPIASFLVIMMNAIGTP